MKGVDTGSVNGVPVIPSEEGERGRDAGNLPPRSERQSGTISAKSLSSKRGILEQADPKPRSVSRSIGSMISVLFTGQVFTWISSFVLLMFLPRLLGSVDYGRLFLALSIKEILSMIIEYGGTHFIPKEIARRKEGHEEFIGHQAIVRLSLWSISLTGVFISAALLEESRFVLALVLVLLIGTAFETLSKVLRAYYQGIESMRIPVIGQVIERLLVTLLAVSFLLMGGGPMVIAMVFAFGSMVHLGILQRLGKGIIRLRPRLSKNPSSSLSVNGAMRSAMGVATPYFLWSVFSVLYYRVDAVMLTRLIGEQVTGWYGAAVRFFDAIMILPMIFRIAIYPVFSRLVADHPAQLELLFEKSIRIVLLGSIPIAVLIFLHSNSVIELFMGLGDFLPSVIILQVFALSVPVMFVDFVLGSAVLGAADLQKRWAWVGASAITLNILLNLWLIPQFNSTMGNAGVGAAIATLVTELMILVSAVVLLPRRFFSRFSWKLFARIPLLAGLVIVLSAATLHLPAHWIFQGFISGILFAVLTVRLGLLQPDEMRYAKASMVNIRHFLGERFRILKGHLAEMKGDTR